MSTTAAPGPAAHAGVSLHRIEVRVRPGVPDSRGEAALREAHSLRLPELPERIEHAAVYFVRGDLNADQLARIASELLADPVLQVATLGAAPSDAAVVEVHPLAGVTDPAAESVELAIEAMLGTRVEVRTGSRWDFHGIPQASAGALAGRFLANPVIHDIHLGAFLPSSFPSGRPYTLRRIEVPVRELDDAALERLSRDAHLFLSLDEMLAVRAAYRDLGREPSEIELETIAQTWSEHCVHKTLKSTVRYREGANVQCPLRAEGRPGHTIGADGEVTIANLLKSTIAAATFELMADGVDWCLSVFVDNAGVVAFDDEHAVCFKCETHNHPSAIEPYGGAATGIGGCIRDIMGTGLAAKPIAATDVFCVAPPDTEEVPEGCLQPARILRQVVAGVRDYGNRMGIPTINGAVWFDPDYVGNPLVYCGCIGVMPRHLVKGEVREGDAIVAVGGRTGRDGIHGATFSSAELTDTHADEFSHAVQIGNAITQKKALDAILEARDVVGGPLFRAITDCGAGGFSSAVGEMGATLGAEVHLDRAPLKYQGLSPTEIWISEAQERMVMAVPPDRLPALRGVCAAHDVEMCELGTFGTAEREIVLKYEGEAVGRIPVGFLHDGIPMPSREARFDPAPSVDRGAPAQLDAISASSALISLLAHPNIASKHWIVRQYDHEVQGGSVVKPLLGPHQDGPSDAAVIRPVPSARRGLAVANGLATGLADDPYLMALAAIDECVRNLVCVGADPARIALLDNFSWPSCRDAESMGLLVRAAEGCYDGAKAYRAPFVSGKDSLNNQFATEGGRTIRIPATLLISGMAIVPDAERCVTMDAKRADSILLLVGPSPTTLRGSHFARLFGGDEGALPEVDLRIGPLAARGVAAAIAAGLVRAAHDASDGGMLVAAAEMAFAGGIGLTLDLGAAEGGPSEQGSQAALLECFAEAPSRYLLEVDPARLPEVERLLGGVPHRVVGRFNPTPRLTAPRLGLDQPLEVLRHTWLKPLDW
ncbi:MAG: hypothetical protein KDA22_03675 [Phycisphaerales bacterium]|nr:hypothetical protein [Phycisphaerales bacterium]